jgi:tetratricopeptide (TPR) repeat protein
MNNLAMTYLGSRKLDVALPLLEDTLKLRKVKLGTDHPDTLASMNNLALAYLHTRKLDLALPLYQDTLKLRTAKLGADHPDTLMSMNNLAGAYQEGGKLDLALPLFEEAAAGMEKRRFQHLHAARTVNNLISCQERLKQFDQAEPWRRKWLAVVKKRSGAESAASADELAALGSNLLQQENWTNAEAVLCECLAIRVQRQPDAWTTFNTQSMLGGALLRQKKYADAEPLLLKGYEGMKQRTEKMPPQTKDARLREALERMVQLYDAKNESEEAAKWRKELNDQRNPAETP